jgi:putative phosphoesterase
VESWTSAVRAVARSGSRAIPETNVVQIGGVRIYVIHDLKELEVAPAAAGFDVVVSGHSHRPSIEKREGVLFVNPGSAGPRRFKLPVSVARLKIKGRTVYGELVELSLNTGV